MADELDAQMTGRHGGRLEGGLLKSAAHIVGDAGAAGKPRLFNGFGFRNLSSDLMDLGF